MTTFTIRQLFNIGIISKQLKQVLVILGCTTFEDMVELSNDKIKVDYIERSYHLKDELFKAIYNVNDLEEIIPEFTATVDASQTPRKVNSKPSRTKPFKVGDFTASLLKKSDSPINQKDLLAAIKEFLPDTYIESIRANLNGDPKKRFVFFLDGYVGLRGKEYDKRFQVYSIANKKVQYAEQRIMEFLSFMEEKHRSPQPHGLEEEESLYRWYLDFTKSTAKELSSLRSTFKEYLKDYKQWLFTPFEYAYKRNCDQMKWYVDKNMELPTAEDEPELSTWFNSQLENYTKHKDKRKQMFIELMDFLADYGMHFYDAKSEKGKATIKEKEKKESKSTESPLDKYIRLFKSIKGDEGKKGLALQKALLIIAIGNLVQACKISTNEVTLTDELLTEFADVCIDVVGTASSYNIAVPYYYMSEEPFWSLIPKEWVVREDREETEITYDYVEQTVACSLMDNDLFDVLSNKEDFDILKMVLLGNRDNKKESTEYEPDEERISKKVEDRNTLLNKVMTKGPRSNLRVVMNGELFENDKAVITFVDVLKRIGLDRIRALGMTWCKIPLISTVKDEKYNQKFEDGYYINVNSSTDRKQKQLCEIAASLGIEIKVDIIDSEGNVV